MTRTKPRAVKRKGESWRVQYDVHEACERRNLHGSVGIVFDEVVLLDGEHQVFHIERMDRHAWWVGLGEDTMLWVHRDRSGKYVVTITEHTPSAAKVKR